MQHKDMGGGKDEFSLSDTRQSRVGGVGRRLSSGVGRVVVEESGSDMKMMKMGTVHVPRVLGLGGRGW